MRTSRVDARRTFEPRRTRSNAGFTYLGVLLAVALLGLGLTAAAQIWSKRAERERLARMDAIGAEYVAAIAAYQQGAPGIVVSGLPQSVGSMIRDPRLVTVRRYLRREYPNPFTGRPDWEFVLAPDGGILGIRGNAVIDGRTVTREYIYRPPVPLSPPPAKHR